MRWIILGIVVIGILVSLFGFYSRNHQRDAGSMNSLPPLDGRALYARCQACHGESGQGMADLGPALAGNPLVIGPPESLHAVISQGRAGGPWRVAMRSYAPDFSPSEMATLLTYLRQAWGHQASPVTTYEIQAMLEKTAGKTP